LSENLEKICENGQAIYLVDTADFETKRAAFNTRSVHVIPNK